MRYEQVTLEAGTTSVTVALHPKLTVIAGVGRVERDLLITEILGALGGSRQGSRLDVVDDRGTTLAVHRPHGGQDRVIDTASGEDVTERYRRLDGEVDLLAPLGLDEGTARRACRLTAADLGDVDRHRGAVERLAALDQDRLWPAAERVVDTGKQLRAATSALEAVPAAPGSMERVDRAYKGLEDARNRNHGLGRNTLLIGAVSAVAAVPFVKEQPLLALTLLAVTMVSLGMSYLCQLRHQQARRELQAALEDADVSSYLGCQVRRLEGMLTVADLQRRFAYAQERHADARAGWVQVAGEVDAEWAMEHRSQILASALARREIGQVQAPEDERERATAIADAVADRMAKANRIGRNGEALPLFFDEPFAGLSPAIVARLLAVAARSAGKPQVVYFTTEEMVAAWARRETATGSVGLLEPATPEATTPPVPRGLTDQPIDASQLDSVSLGPIAPATGPLAPVQPVPIDLTDSSRS